VREVEWLDVSDTFWNSPNGKLGAWQLRLLDSDRHKRSQSANGAFRSAGVGWPTPALALRASGGAIEGVTASAALFKLRTPVDYSKEGLLQTLVLLYDFQLNSAVKIGVLGRFIGEKTENQYSIVVIADFNLFCNFLK